MPARCSALDHRLELAHLPAAATRRVAHLGREEADRVVAPVVREAAIDEVAVVHEVVDRQQLDGGHPERRQVVEDRVGDHAEVGAAQVLGDARVQLREAAHVGLVDHGLVPRHARRLVVAPGERGVDDDALRHRPGAVAVVAMQVGVRVPDRVAEDGVVPAHLAADRLRVGVEQELRRVEAMALLRRPRALDPVAVELPRPRVGQVAVPVRSVRWLMRMRSVGTASSSFVNRQSSTPVACSEKIEKLTPSPSQVAPWGYGTPGQTRITTSLPRKTTNEHGASLTPLGSCCQALPGPPKRALAESSRGSHGAVGQRDRRALASPRWKATRISSAPALRRRSSVAASSSSVTDASASDSRASGARSRRSASSSR